MNKGPSELIDVGELRMGMFVELGIGWMSHPFPTGRFCISSVRQIETIRALGLMQVRYFPDRSLPVDRAESARLALSDAVVAAPDSAALSEDSTPQDRPSLIALVDAQRRCLMRCERRFQEVLDLYKFVLNQVQAQPRLVKVRCQALIGGLVDELLEPGDSSIRLLSIMGGERSAAHAVNVSVLSLLLGKAMGLSRAELAELGAAAFLHDIGKLMLPERVRCVDEHFSTAEYKLYQEHVLRSVELGQQIGLSSEALVAIGQHHELADGSGFPRHSKGGDLSLPGKILAVVNRYDSLCNPARPMAAMTPHEALSSIFTQMKGRFDGVVLSAFIRMMGVHPPGSIIQLTNEHYALVMAANTSRPLKPRVLVHDPAVPRSEALILDLEQMPGVGIRRSIKPGNLPLASAEYLAPRQRVCYFLERTQTEEALAA